MARPNPSAQWTEPSPENASLAMYGVLVQDLTGAWIRMPGVVVMPGDIDADSVWLNDRGGAALANGADETLNGYTVETADSTT